MSNSTDRDPIDPVIALGWLFYVAFSVVFVCWVIWLAFSGL